ncbi:phage major tail tube protein [Burkholderia glumae]|uniref:phage major tail tube protein n=1 Tax=Burkholderia glumae TaxID=337 RepID=UPI001FD76328|nr:phage major tail tube protein [Burkholderia glumae]
MSINGQELIEMDFINMIEKINVTTCSPVCARQSACNTPPAQAAGTPLNHHQDTQHDDPRHQQHPYRRRRTRRDRGQHAHLRHADRAR